MTRLKAELDQAKDDLQVATIQEALAVATLENNESAMEEVANELKATESAQEAVAWMELGDELMDNAGAVIDMAQEFRRSPRWNMG